MQVIGPATVTFIPMQLSSIFHSPGPIHFSSLIILCTVLI